MKATASDVIALEGNAAKNTVRNEIIAQMMERRDSTEIQGSVRCLTLPGINFLFEQSATTLYNFGQLEDDSIMFDCCEGSRNRYDIAAKRVPLNCEFKYSRFEKMPLGHYHMIWADYCSTPDKHELNAALQQAINSAKKVRNVMLYGTVCLHHRLGGGRTICKNLGVAGDDAREAVWTYIERYMRRRGIPWKKIYDVRYAGGRAAKTGMLTFGIVLSRTRSLDITKVVEDRRQNTGWKKFKKIKPKCPPRKKNVRKPMSLDKHILFALKVRMTTMDISYEEMLTDDALLQKFVDDTASNLGCIKTRVDQVASNYLAELAANAESR